LHVWFSDNQLCLSNGLLLSNSSLSYNQPFDNPNRPDINCSLYLFTDLCPVLEWFKQYSQVLITGRPISRKSRYPDTFVFGHRILVAIFVSRVTDIRSGYRISSPNHATYPNLAAILFPRTLTSRPNIRIWSQNRKYVLLSYHATLFPRDLMSGPDIKNIVLYTYTIRYPDRISNILVRNWSSRYRISGYRLNCQFENRIRPVIGS
jgi:hypothetical protein